MKIYKPLKIITHEVRGIRWALDAVRLPFDRSEGDSDFKKDIHGEKDLTLLSRLQATGDDHGKANRAIDVWVKFQFQAGWMVELETYRIGIDTLSTSSSMHNELKSLFGNELAEQKQLDLPEKVYIRSSKITYQTLRHMYFARRHHKHPCWHVWCDWIETLPYADILITQKPLTQIKIEKLQQTVKELQKRIFNLEDELLEYRV